MNIVLSDMGTVENMKASLIGAVPYGVCSYEFKTSNPKDIHQHVGLYILHELSTPQQV